MFSSLNFETTGVNTFGYFFQLVDVEIGLGIRFLG